MSLSIQNLSAGYEKGRTVLHDVTFAAERGLLLSVLGPNGVGKSTLFRCILGSLGYTGAIAFEGRDLRAMSQREKAKCIAYIPQAHRPTFGYTVLDTVLMGTTRQLGTFSQPGQPQLDAARDALRLLGIETFAARSFNHLSGGEQQLVLIARALAQQADVLVMDEPTSSLDYGNQLRVLERVRALAHRGYTVLLSTHDPQHALTFADRVLALCGGTVAAFGAPDEVLTQEMMRRLYRVETEFLTAHGRRVLVPLPESTFTDGPSASAGGPGEG